MQQKSDIELQKARNIKIARTLIRLKHSLAADEELNATLPDLALAFDKGVQAGELKRLSLGEILDDL
jgi:hypothetical protein